MWPYKLRSTHIRTNTLHPHYTHTKPTTKEITWGCMHTQAGLRMYTHSHPHHTHDKENHLGLYAHMQHAQAGLKMYAHPHTTPTTKEISWGCMHTQAGLIMYTHTHTHTLTHTPHTRQRKSPGAVCTHAARTRRAENVRTPPHHTHDKGNSLGLYAHSSRAENVHTLTPTPHPRQRKSPGAVCTHKQG